MSRQALDILKLVLLGLLYVFFARVLWAVWTEVRVAKRAPAAAVNERAETVATVRRRAARPPKGRKGNVARLVILEPKQRRGEAFALHEQITIGRDPGSDVVIENDSFVSTHHARVYRVDGQPMVEDAGSTNGSFHNGNKLVGARLLHPGDRVQVGYTVLEAQ